MGALELSASLQGELEDRGFALLPGVLAEHELGPLREEADRILLESPERGGARNALRVSGLFAALGADGAPASIAAALLGPAVRAVKLTVFDKVAAANWKVPFHQDLTLVVAERREVEGFGPWSVKEGLPHVQAPAAVLEGLLAIRLHLDETSADNGALRALPCTHRSGRLTQSEIAAARERIEETICPVPVGGAMLMRPLLLHASSPSRSPSRRRVLHFEFSASPLPGGLEWG